MAHFQFNFYVNNFTEWELCSWFAETEMNNDAIQERMIDAAIVFLGNKSIYLNSCISTAIWASKSLNFCHKVK